MPRITVELIAQVLCGRFIVIDFPEDATLNELPWEQINEAADARGIDWEVTEGPAYSDWCECLPPEDGEPTDVKIIRARSEMRHGLRVVTRSGEEATELRVAGSENSKSRANTSE
jgi:hypothetical protein